MPKAVFLDRDGVINEDRDDYVKSLRELRVFPYVPEAVRKLNDAGFEVIVISNQQCVAKGLVSPEDLLAIQDEITRQVNEVGGRIAGFYYCTHMASDGCTCRKPEPGLILQAAREHGIELENSFMVGDNGKDIVAGSTAGCRTVAVLTGTLTRESIHASPRAPDFVAEDLTDAVRWIIEQPKAEHK